MKDTSLVGRQMSVRQRMDLDLDYVRRLAMVNVKLDSTI